MVSNLVPISVLNIDRGNFYVRYAQLHQVQAADMGQPNFILLLPLWTHLFVHALASSVDPCRLLVHYVLACAELDR